MRCSLTALRLIGAQRCAARSLVPRPAKLQHPSTKLAPQRWTWARAGSPDQQPGSNEESSSSSSSSSGETPSSARQPTLALIEGEDGELQLPKEVIDRLKTNVFGFDTMWVTSVENYKFNGVVFKGNIRGKDMTQTYKKLSERMKGELGDGYMLFLVQDKDEKPMAVVLSRALANEGEISKLTEIWLAVLFAIATAVTTLDANGVPILQFIIAPFQTEITSQDFYDALPGSLALWFALGAHEWGHYWAAGRRNVELYLPLVIPAGFGFLGSFGGITRNKGFMPNRESLLDIAVSGPLVGTGIALSLTLLGWILTAAGVTDSSIDSVGFSESLLMGTLAQVFLGDSLNNPEVQVNSILIAGWAALVFNALNCIPTGELDGGRITMSIFGRQAASLFSVLTILVLGLTSLNSPLSFYWVLLVLLLQRGPVLPCEEEISEPQDKQNINTGLALLAVPLLVLVPYPVEFLLTLQNLGQPAQMQF